MSEYTPKPPTVEELIAILHHLPKDLPIYIRSKYTGDTNYAEDYPMNPYGVSEMESDELGKHVVFLF